MFNINKIKQFIAFVAVVFIGLPIMGAAAQAVLDPSGTVTVINKTDNPLRVSWQPFTIFTPGKFEFWENLQKNETYTFKPRREFIILSIFDKEYALKDRRLIDLDVLPSGDITLVVKFSPEKNQIIYEVQPAAAATPTSAERKEDEDAATAAERDAALRGGYVFGSRESI